VIDAYGRIAPHARLGLGEFGVIDARLPPALAPTPYVRWNDGVFALMVLVSLGAVFTDRVRRA
jgi:apolipoprotein N-acyltransferase